MSAPRSAHYYFKVPISDSNQLQMAAKFPDTRCGHRTNRLAYENIIVLNKTHGL